MIEKIKTMFYPNAVSKYTNPHTSVSSITTSEIVLQRLTYICVEREISSKKEKGYLENPTAVFVAE